MTRMSREFSLVLLGAGVLTAGYFLFRDDNDLFGNEEDKSKQQVDGNHRRSGGMIFIYGHGYSGGKSTSPATAGGVARGGFGSMGAHAGS